MERVAQVRGLEKRYGGRLVLKGIDLEVPRGSAYGLVGPNGAGKTTFIKVLLGIVRASTGEVELMGRVPQDPRSRASVGYLPERLTLPEAWTPVAWLRSVLRLKGVSGDPAALLEEVRLDPEAHRRRMGGFSKGMKQRVGLAGALAGAPQVLVLDEPTDGIDPIGRMEIRELLAARVREGVTVFLNSHLLAETERLCDHVAILGGGRLLVSGALADLRSQGAPRARFEPRPDLPELCARHDLHPVEGGWAARDATPETMSRALAGILAEGAVLRELTEPASDLEMVLREAVEAEAA